MDLSRFRFAISRLLTKDKIKERSPTEKSIQKTQKMTKTNAAENMNGLFDREKTKKNNNA